VKCARAAQLAKPEGAFHVIRGSLTSRRSIYWGEQNLLAKEFGGRWGIYRADQ